MTIFIARHGQTNDNAQRILQRPDSPLSELGERQAQHLATRLATAPIAHILSSDYLRTQQTAEPIAKITGAKLTTTALLRERNFGRLRGIAYDELKQHPFAPDLVPPEGESWPIFYARVAQAWDMVTELAARIDGSLMVMTHGFVCRALCERHLVIPAGKSQPTEVQNTALTIVADGAPWTVELLNCAQHLIDIEGATQSAPI